MIRPHSTRKYGAPATAILLLLIGYALYVFRFGYGYGASDQDEFIPYLLQLLNPSLFENDWFVQTQQEAFSIRTWFVYLLRICCMLMPPWLAVLLVYLASWASIALALFRLADLLTHNRLAAALGTLVICTFTPFWTLGGNDLLHSMLVPSMTAWAIALWAFAFYLRAQYRTAALMAGLATLFQALVGLQVMALLTGLLVFQYSSSRVHMQDIVRAGVVYLLAGAGALAPLFYQQLSYEPPLLSAGPSLFYIMALFRNPHHYLFDAFDRVRLVQFFLLLLAGYLALLYVHKKDASFRAPFVHRVIGFVTLLCVIGYLGTEVKPVLLIAKLQLFKTTIVLKVLMVIVLSYACVRLLPARLSSQLDRLIFDRPGRLALIAGAGIGVLVLLQPGRLGQKIYPWSVRPSPQYQIARWASDNTEDQEVFAVPPSWSSFRSHAKRSIVINHKAFPYRSEDIPVWYKRLTDMAPIKPPERSDKTLLQALDASYNSLGPNQLEELDYEYTFDYVIRNERLPAASPFSVVFEAQGWLVYKVSPQRLALYPRLQPQSGAGYD